MMVLLLTFFLGTVLIAVVAGFSIAVLDYLVPHARAIRSYRETGAIDMENLVASKRFRNEVALDVLTELAARGRYMFDFETEARTVVAQALVLREEKMLVVELDKGPLIGYWSLPASYIRPVQGYAPDEAVEDEARLKVLELLEDTGSHSEKLLPLPGKLRKIPAFSLPQEGGIVPTDVFIVPFQEQGISVADSPQIRWCTPDELLRLPEKLSPLLSLVVRMFFPNKEQVAEALADRAAREACASSAFLETARLDARKQARMPGVRARVLATVTHALAQASRERLREGIEVGGHPRKTLNESFKQKLVEGMPALRRELARPRSPARK
jgi:ADP-ribose pyrophosphatase YjhB (NUDIX family)